jgi:HlyD family secretion protein
MRTLRLLFVPIFALAGLPAAARLAQEPAPPEPPALFGTLVPLPADALPVELWPEAWSGDWLITEVAAHGTWVHEGQVLARFHPRALQDALERAEQELASAQREHRLSTGRAELEAEAEREKLQAASAALARAQAGFQSWREFELPMRREQAALTDLFAQHGIEDQEAELAQLEAMYGADELTDATEELVLMRGRRNLARARTQLDIARRQRAKTAEFDWVREDQEKEEAFQQQRAAYERLTATAELDSAARRLRTERSEQELTRKQRETERLRRDAALLEVRAPREGLLLHGAASDWESGGGPARLARGDRAPTRRPAFTITGGRQYYVALEVGEAVRARGATAARVSWSGLQEFGHDGRLEIESFPTPKSAGAEESRYAARVTGLGELKGAAPGMRVSVRLQP